MEQRLSAERQQSFDDLYQGAMGKDGDRIRAALTDDFTFRGPLASFDNPADFIESLLAVDATVTRSRVIVQDSRAAHLFVLEITAPFRAAIPMCDVLEFDGGRIRRIELYADSKDFQPVEA